jgi:hypothetical protein
MRMAGSVNSHKSCRNIADRSPDAPRGSARPTSGAKSRNRQRLFSLGYSTIFARLVYIALNWLASIQVM